MRSRPLCVLIVASLAMIAAAREAPAADGDVLVRLVADRDDDDTDGTPDGEQAELPVSARVDLIAIPPSLVGKKVFAFAGAARARIVVDGKPLAWGSVIPHGAMLQGIEPGYVDLVAQDAQNAGGQHPFRAIVVGAGFHDGERRAVDITRDHASLERTPPERIYGDVNSRYDDPDAMRVWLETADPGARAPRATLVSYGAAGEKLDAIDVPLERAQCANATELTCFGSAPVRFVVDDVDKRHPLVSARSVVAEVGGAIVITQGGVDGTKLQRIRVGGPRLPLFAKTQIFSAKIRPFIVRTEKGGPPSIGVDDKSALAAGRMELALASSIWGQCGITFGSYTVKVVDPPPPHLVAFGDTGGLGASGGTMTFAIEKKNIRLELAQGMSPVLAAQAFSLALEKEGFVGVVSSNARAMPGARPGADVSVRKANGDLTTVTLTSATDATMTVRVGAIDFADGLEHFTDSDSVAGTLEERTLVKALDDGDPTTIEVVIIPRFSGSGRIGESFISSDFSSVRNIVLIDRAGIRARSTSLTLAHELGHVLLDMPGHPDDYGVDTPTLLMDSDAADGSAFGPRRLTLAECSRAILQSGPDARVPLLTAHPFAPLVIAPRRAH